MILYKYMGISGLKAILKKNTLRFTNPLNFNDPFDCAMSSLGSETLNDDTALSNSIRMHSHRSKSGILCLTRNQFNLLMWAHYADNHRGAVVGIDTEIAELNCEIKNIITAKSGSVIYSSIRPTSQGLSLPETVDSKSDRTTLEKMYLHKSIHWAYEEEVRIVRPINPEYDPLSLVDTLPYQDMSIPKDAIKQIYLGSRYTSSLDQEISLQDILTKYPKTTFGKCYLDNTTWNIKSISVKKMLGPSGFIW
jgi:hypothetical protein